MTSPKQFTTKEQSFDTITLMLYVLGVHDSILREPPYCNSLFTPMTLKADIQLRELRALCCLRTILFKTGSQLLNIPSFQFKPVDSLIHTPAFVLAGLKDIPSNPMRVKGAFYKRINLIQQLIDERIPALYPHFPEGEKHPDYVTALLKAPKFESDEEVRSFMEDFVRSYSLYPYRIWMNNPEHKVLDDLFVDDYHLLFLCYKTFGLPNALKGFKSRLYKKNALTPTIPQSTESASSAFEYLKAVLSEEDAYNVALIDSQNLKPAVVIQFFTWLATEYAESFEKVYLLVDGKENWKWDTMETLVDLPVTRITVPRVIEGKSAVDPVLFGMTLKEYYEYSVNNFFILSSDCDFLPLADLMPKAKFCFCGMSGSTSQHSKEYARSRSNAHYLILDDLLEYVNEVDNGRNTAIDRMVDALNDKRLDVSDLISKVSEICRTSGERSEQVVSISMLNQAFASFHVRVTKDGCLEFKLPWSHWDS